MLSFITRERMFSLEVGETLDPLLRRSVLLSNRRVGCRWDSFLFKNMGVRGIIHLSLSDRFLFLLKGWIQFLWLTEEDKFLWRWSQ